jgi:hypothetical protein
MDMGGERDAGRVAVFFAIMMPAWLALMGLIVVGGNRIIALQRADNIAAEAARAAGQAIDAPDAISGGSKILDPTAAAAAAAAYIASAGATPAGIVIAPDRQHVAITVQVTYDPGIFGIFGSTWTAEGNATATLVVT